MNLLLKKKLLIFWVILSYIPNQFIIAQSNSVITETRLDWWREARFGLFIHWGLYSVAAGEWNGKEIDGIGEWIQNFAKIPNSEYNKLVKDFTLSNYHPEEWVALAKQTGTKYIVFTAKHHEGFALYPHLKY